MRRADPPPRGRVGMGRRLRRRQPHTAKPYAARRASALTAQLVEMAAFVGVGEAAGKLKAAVLV